MKISKLILLIFVLMLASSCSNHHSKVHAFEEKVLNDSSLKRLVKLIGLKELLNDDDNFEIRIWTTFLREKYPVQLQRVVSSSDECKFEKYFFFKSDFTPVMDTKYLNKDSVRIKTYTLDLACKIADSLKVRITPESLIIQSQESVKTERSKIVSVQTPSMCLYEIKFKNNYIKTFITNPQFIIIDRLPSYKPYLQLLNFFKELSDGFSETEQEEYKALIKKLYLNTYK